VGLIRTGSYLTTDLFLNTTDKSLVISTAKEGSETFFLTFKTQHSEEANALLQITRTIGDNTEELYGLINRPPFYETPPTKVALDFSEGSTSYKLPTPIDAIGTEIYTVVKGLQPFMKYNEVKNQIEFDESSAIEGTYEIVVVLRDDRYAT
jgi:hypothetical protein